MPQTFFSAAIDQISFAHGVSVCVEKRIAAGIERLLNDKV
jgi:hypothetical protein